MFGFIMSKMILSNILANVESRALVYTRWPGVYLSQVSGLESVWRVSRYVGLYSDLLTCCRALSRQSPPQVLHVERRKAIWT